MMTESLGYGWTYDVFLSFRGEDTRLGFTGNLYKALCDKGIHTFIDDEQLQRGNQITPTLVKAIQESKIAILVLSENYASSSFCLDELVNILHCSNNKGALVLPIFYDVDPSDVRHLRGSYGEALAKHEERFKFTDNPSERLEKWKMALQQVANLSGWHFKHGDGYEYKFIGSIVKIVSDKFNRPPLYVADHPVGLEFQVLQVQSLLYGGSDDGVCMVGIYGIGGIGKTTIAREVYNLIAHQFEGLCFLEDVRENSKKHGLVHFQETLLSEIVRDKDIKLGSVSRGIPIIKHRLQQKKVLLVLDDVDELEQLRAIVGGPDWFGSGSKVIITTRDKHLLTSHGVERTYEATELKDKEALELLSWTAFKTDKVDPSYLDILSRAVTYACGLPLAVEVIGSNLSGKTQEEWESALDEYERIPIRKIQDILKISYESLEEQEQNTFLDIACCFKGHDLKYVKKILSAHHGVCLEYGIGVLVAKSLIKISYGCLKMHDLIEDMGKEIVRQESPNDPGKRSRLWLHEDIVQVIEENMGTSRIQIIILDFHKFEVVWDGRAFKKMKKLKTLIIRNVCFSNGPKHLPNSLRVLEWQGYPSTSLPSDFCPKKLVILDLPRSCLISLELFLSRKKFVNTTVLNFNECQCITEIPDVSSVPHLEELSFSKCENLIKIHESVGFLDKLRILDATRCSELRTFPPIKLTSLKQLELSHCTRLKSFPEILGKMEAITDIQLEDAGIEEFPFSIQYLTRLRKLEVRSSFVNIYLPSSIVTLPELEDLVVRAHEVFQSSEEDNGEEKVSSFYSSNLKCLDLTECGISNEFLQKCLTWFANVKYLDLSNTTFTILPACIKECQLLRRLDLYDCPLLRQIEGIPPNLEKFNAKYCKALKYLDLTLLPAGTKECHFLKEIFLDNCKKLQEIKGVPRNVKILSVKKCKSLTSLGRSKLLNQELHESARFSKFICPGTEIPEWFDHRTCGPSIYFWFRNNFPTISLCVIFGKLEWQLEHIKGFYIRLNKRETFLAENVDNLADHVYIYDILSLTKRVDEVRLESEWNHVEVSTFSIYQYYYRIYNFPIQMGLHVVKQGSCMEDIRFTDPYKRGKFIDGLITLE